MTYEEIFAFMGLAIALIGVAWGTCVLVNLCHCICTPIKLFKWTYTKMQYNGGRDRGIV
jgi:hypothetical protein